MVHMTIIFLLGLYVTSPANIALQPTVDSRWSSDTLEPVLDPRPQRLPSRALEVTMSGGTTGVAALLEPSRSRRIVDPINNLRETAHAAAPHLTPADLGQRVAALADGGLPTGMTGGNAGQGTGRGTSQGAGAGTGFFGVDASVSSVVFVVDCSGSMNRPHDSAAKTRFRRLKFELIKSIGNMKPSTRFFIVFFNDRAHPMPAQGLQNATAPLQQHYLKWMAKVPAGGETDPRAALNLALLLSPEAIYFLTDGSFAHKIDRELLKLHQRRVSIHTFAFGDRGAEIIMKALANNNGGRYHFVP